MVISFYCSFYNLFILEYTHVLVTNSPIIALHKYMRIANVLTLNIIENL